MAVTENITVLFTDLVGSTEMAASLTPEAGDELRRGHFSVLRQAIAEAGGTEVKNLGDGVMVVFPSNSAALSCAVAMQQAVDRGNRNAQRSLGLRIGLSCGEASREADDYFGDPVIEAARLCAKSYGGQILATDAVRLLAGRRNRHECRSVGALALTGLPDPVEALEVVWEPLGEVDAGTVIPLPVRLAERPAVGDVVGRESQLAMMADAAKRVAGGEGREVILVSGEAGLGKTTLVAEAARAAGDAGSIVLFGHCEEGLATPYQLFAEALGHYVTHAPEDQLPYAGAYGSELARLLPALSSRIPDLPPSQASDTDTERFLLFAAVVGLLTTTAERQPVVLVLDDLQWADRGSLLLLGHLAASSQAMRVLILGAYRDSELARAPALIEMLGVLRRQERVSRIELTGLDDTGVLALMEAIAGYSLDEAAVGLAQAVYRETDGNPFFVTEVLRHLAETRAIYQDASGQWVADESLDQTALPVGVREVIGARVVRLGPAAGKVLSLAAVIGRDFDLDVLARATSTSEDEMLDTLDAAAAAALVGELSDTPGRYNFTHALIQHTLYEEQGPTRRARAHRKVAEALEELCGDRPGARVGELARHWFNASQPIDLAKAISYARKAGDAALTALAPADALGYYAQALDLYPKDTDPDPELALDLAIGLGTAQRQTGDPAFRSTLLETAHRAADLGDTQRLVSSALANDRGFGVLGGPIDGDKIEVLEMALARLPVDHPDRALVLATLCKELAGSSSLERRSALSDEAFAIAESSGDEATIVRVLNLVSLTLRVPPLLDRLLSRSADALDRATRIGDPALLFAAAASRSVTAVQSGDLDEVDRCIEIARSHATRLSQPTFSWVLAIERAMRSLIAGDTDRAERLAREAHQIGIESGQPDAGLVFSAQYLGVSWQRGTLADLVPLIEQALIENPGIPSLVAGLALAHAEGERTDEARKLLTKVDSPDQDAPSSGFWLFNMTVYAEVAIECRDAASAERQFKRLAPWASQFSAGVLATQGPVSHYLGGLAAALGRYDEAEAYFGQAAESNERTGAKFFAARTFLQCGKMLSERQGLGDSEKARDLLVRAHAAAAANRYGNVERRAAEALKLSDA